jgi:hypothetical protein
MKKVIHLEENSPSGFYDGRASQNARQHLFFLLCGTSIQSLGRENGPMS